MGNPIYTTPDKLFNADYVRIWLTNAIAHIHFYMLLAAFPFYVKFLGGSELIVGLIAGGFSFFSLVTRPVCGWLLDHRSRCIALFCGLLASAFFSIGYIILPWLAVALLMRLIHAVGWSSVSTSVHTDICDYIPEDKLSQGLGFFNIGSVLGMAFAPGLGLWVMNRFGFTPMFICSASLMVIAFCLAYGVKYRTNHLPENKSRFREEFRPKDLFTKSALPGSVVQFFAMMPYMAIGSFAALYAESLGYDSSGTFFLLMALSSVGVRLFSGIILDRFGEAPGVYWANFMYVTTLIFLAFCHSELMFLAAGLTYGLGMGMGIPSLHTMAVRTAPAKLRGAASSTYLCSYDISSTLGGFLAGVIITAFSYQLMFASMIIWVMISTVIYIFWASKTPAAFKNCRNKSTSPSD